jgi:predicted amidophosphoribosyltransferase
MSKTTICRFCGEKIDAGAKVCEHCESVLTQPTDLHTVNIPPPPHHHHHHRLLQRQILVQ